MLRKWETLAAAYPFGLLFDLRTRTIVAISGLDQRPTKWTFHIHTLDENRALAVTCADFHDLRPAISDRKVINATIAMHAAPNFW
jgi:hypothetical protein